MDNNFRRKQQFETKLNDDLFDLAQKWRNEQNVPQIDDKIQDIRRSGEAILFRAGVELTRMSSGSPYDIEHREFFIGLTHEHYTPHLQGTKLFPGSNERKAALKLLKNFASYIGSTIHRDQTTISADATNEDSATAEYVDRSGDGFQETTPNTGVKKPATAPAATATPNATPPEDDKAFQWLYDSPLPDAVDEFAALREEASRIKEIISKATAPTELKNYITNTLKPRLTEVKQELKARRAGFDNETSYQMVNANLIAFADSLEILMLQGLRRIKPQAPKAEPIALAAPSQQESLESRLEKLASRIDAGLAQAQGAQLKSFYDNRLKPKLIALKGEIDALKDSGGDQNALNEKEQHFNVIKEAMTKAYQKIQAEKSAETSKPKDFYGEVLKPEAMALIAEIKSMKELGADPAALDVKERHLKVLQASMSEILRKRRAEIDAEINAKGSKSSAVPLLIEEILVFPTLPTIEATVENKASAEPWTPRNQAPFKFPDPATAEAATGYPVLPQPEAEAQDERPWEDTVPTLSEVVQESATIPALQDKKTEITRYRSPNVMKQFPGIDSDKGDSETSKDGGNANSISDVQFRMQAPAANNQSFWRRHFKKAAVGISGALVTFAIAAGVWSGGSHAPDAQSVKKDATPEPTAQVVQHEVVQQPTIILAAAPANDVSPAPVAPAPVAEVAAPEATIEATPVAPTVTAKAPTIVKHFAKAKVAAPTVDVQDNTPLVEKTWDIATSRVDLETWNNACKALNQHNLTVSGVCPQ